MRPKQDIAYYNVAGAVNARSTLLRKVHAGLMFTLEQARNANKGCTLSLTSALDGNE
jgi:hypothetical protein